MANNTSFTCVVKTGTGTETGTGTGTGTGNGTGQKSITTSRAAQEALFRNFTRLSAERTYKLKKIIKFELDQEKPGPYSHRERRTKNKPTKNSIKFKLKSKYRIE